MVKDLEPGKEKPNFSRRRSLHFIPEPLLETLTQGNLASLSADMVVIDLEDSVRPKDKVRARKNLAEFLQSSKRSMIQGEICVRINDLDTPWGEDDVKTLGKQVTIMVPKIKSFREAFPTPSFDVIPIIESPHSLYEVKRMIYVDNQYAPKVKTIVFGKEDFLAELGHINTDPNSSNPLPSADLRFNQVLRESFVYIMSKPYEGDFPSFLKDRQFIDGVTRKLGQDPETITDLRAEARFARMLGATGKLSVYPWQIEPLNSVFQAHTESTIHSTKKPDFNQNLWEVPNLKAKLENAKRIIKVFEENTRPQNAAVIEIDQEMIMIGPPMYKLCKKILEGARAA